jgi:hypothetical protein
MVSLERYWEEDESSDEQWLEKLVLAQYSHGDNTCELQQEVDTEMEHVENTDVTDEDIKMEDLEEG